MYCRQVRPMSRLGAPSSPKCRMCWRSLLGDAEDVADHRDRQLRAVPLHDVDDAGFAVEVVEQLVGGLLHAFPQRGDGPGGEHRRHQLAAAGVVGRLDRQQRRRLDGMQQPGVGLLVDPLQRCGQACRPATTRGSRRSAASRWRPGDRRSSGPRGTGSRVRGRAFRRRTRRDLPAPRGRRSAGPAGLAVRRTPTLDSARITPCRANHRILDALRLPSLELRPRTKLQSERPNA